MRGGVLAIRAEGIRLAGDACLVERTRIRALPECGAAEISTQGIAGFHQLDLTRTDRISRNSKRCESGIRSGRQSEDNASECIRRANGAGSEALLLRHVTAIVVVQNTVGQGDRGPAD